MVQTNPVLLSQLRDDYEAIQAMGSPILSCQGMLVPRGMEEVRFLIKSCPRPIVSNEDPAITQYAGGFSGITPSVPKTQYSGNITLVETEQGHVQMLAEYIVASGGAIDCDYYDGRADSFTRAYELLNCAIRFEPADFDTESRSQSMTISAPMDYNYFGSFADIGANGTVSGGQRSLSGIGGFIQRVQNVVNVAQQATRTARSVVNTVSSIGKLFG